MSYTYTPFYPPPCGMKSSLCLPLFEGGDCGCAQECQRVRICNPACPGEYADVELCVDSDGNLSVCVHRPPRPCPPRRGRPARGCGRCTR